MTRKPQSRVRILILERGLFDKGEWARGDHSMRDVTIINKVCYIFHRGVASFSTICSHGG